MMNNDALNSAARLSAIALLTFATLTSSGCSGEAVVEETPQDLETSRQQHIDRSNAERGQN
jgi:hypothetical protein